MRKVWAFLEKIMIYHFYVATIMWAILKKGGGGGGGGANVANVFLLNTALLGSSGYFLQVNTVR